MAALAQVPELLEVAVPFIGTALGPSAISWRRKELVIVRVSALMRCQYCVRAHTTVALDAGLTRVEILALRGSTGLQVFTDPAERALLGWVDAVAGGPGPVDPKAFKALRLHFADHEIVELTTLVGATLMLNRFATALELPAGVDTLRRLEAEDLLSAELAERTMNTVAEAVAEGRLPGRVWLYANYRCNLTCTYCLTESAPRVARREPGPSRRPAPARREPATRQ